MAVFKCEKCGATIDTRCKPKKCHVCGEMACMCKEETGPGPQKGQKVTSPKTKN